MKASQEKITFSNIKKLVEDFEKYFKSLELNDDSDLLLIKAIFKIYCLFMNKQKKNDLDVDDFDIVQHHPEVLRSKVLKHYMGENADALKDKDVYKTYKYQVNEILKKMIKIGFNPEELILKSGRGKKGEKTNYFVRISDEELSNNKKEQEIFHPTKPLLEYGINKTKIHQICAETAKALIKDSGKETPDLLKEKAKDCNDLERAIQKYAQMFVREHNLIKIIGMTKPTSLDKIFVKANILEKITSNRSLNLEDWEEWERKFRKRRSYGKIVEEKVDALELANKTQYMMLLGQPGGGKTTFLKQLGMQAIQGKLNSKRIPVFISLKVLSDNKKGLFDFILKEFKISGFPEANDFVEKSLNDGLFLLLLDGLDEVGKEHAAKICDQINDFCRQYSDNQYLISCRTAAHHDNFPRFTNVELARFDENQIKQFINNWFGKCNSTASKCWKKIKADKNKPILELAQTPLLLILSCLAFDENMDFPENRAELYQSAINVLLKKWDKSRYIDRGEVYQHLSQKRKKILLSQIAFETFGNDKYFIKKGQVETIIDKFMGGLFDDPPEGEIILKAIEEQHGILVKRSQNIYSFSHLTFQEFFAANYIVENEAEGTLNNLIGHITDSRWREIFLLTAGLLSEADDFLLLLKNKTDSLIQDEKLKKFFCWAKEKADSFQEDYKPAAKRNYYIYNVYTIISHSLSIRPPYPHPLNHPYPPAQDLALMLAIDIDIDYGVNFHTASSHPNRTTAVERGRNIACDLGVKLGLEPTPQYYSFNPFLDCDQLISFAYKQAKRIRETSLRKSLKKLYSQIPKNKDVLEKWESWTEKLRKIIINERNIGHDWDFSNKQINCMNYYLYANNLIVDCLNCGSYVTKSVREEIENTLLLPFGENQNSGSCNL